MNEPGSALLLADAADALASLPDASVDLLLTDPPWGMSRLALDAGGAPPAEIWRECRRVVTPAGRLMIFGPLGVAVTALNEGWRHEFELIWIKPKPPLNHQAAYRPTNSHESIHVFHQGSKAGARYYDRDALTTWGHSRYVRRAHSPTGSTYHKEHKIDFIRGRACSDGSRDPCSVLYGYPNKATMSVRERTDHPTQKPISLLQYLIRGYCPAGGMVADPYAGSGSTLVAARSVGRRYWGCEINERWHAVAKSRLVSVLDWSLPAPPPARAAAAMQQPAYRQAGIVEGVGQRRR